MADVIMYHGGTPEPRYMWCGCDDPGWGPPFGHLNPDDVAPFHAKFDGAYGSGLCTFAAGMPFNFKKMPWQKCALKAANLEVGDFIRAIWMPCNHYAKALRFDVARPDARLAGATVRMSAQLVTYDATTKKYVYTPMTDVTDAATAQGKNDPIPLDRQSSTTVFLEKVVSAVTASGTADTTTPSAATPITVSGEGSGYVTPLYCEPAFVPSDPSDASNPYKVMRVNPAIFFGLEIVALPTDTNITLDMAVNDWYLSVRIEGFESSSHM